MITVWWPRCFCCVRVCADSRLVSNVMMQFTSSALVQFYVVFENWMLQMADDGAAAAVATTTNAHAHWWWDIVVANGWSVLIFPHDEKICNFVINMNFSENTIDSSFFFFCFFVDCQSQWRNAMKRKATTLRITTDKSTARKRVSNFDCAVFGTSININ